MKHITLIASFILLSAAPYLSYAQQSNDENEQQTENQTDNTIVVIGEKELDDRVREYVRNVIATPPGGRFKGQYGRLGKPLCVRAYGLSDEFNKAIAARITAVAKASEVPVADIDCKPNAFVVVIDKGKETISFLRRKHRGVFGTLKPSERNRIQNAPGPVFRWQIRENNSSKNGVRPIRDDANRAVDVEGILASVLNDNVQVLTGVEPSRVITATTKSVTASYLLLEEEALLGLTTTQIADYAALSLMLEVSNNQNAELGIPSILSLFDDQKAGRELPESVSEWDLVLLHGWYSIPLDRSAALQRSALLQIIKDELRSGPNP